jgi:hypothetical protein
MKEENVILKVVPLINNCPECYSKNGLQLTFMQKFIETTFYMSITNDISHEIECKTCNSIIYPERWTEDIERVFEYQQKAFVPNQSSLKLKKSAWLTIVLAVILVISIVTIILFL